MDNTHLIEDIGKLIDNKLDPINKKLEGLEQGQARLEAKLEREVARLELKIEAVHEYQKKAHVEIVEMLVTSNEVNGSEQNKLKKRVTRIEDHLRLPHID